MTAYEKELLALAVEASGPGGFSWWRDNHMFSFDGGRKIIDSTTLAAAPALEAVDDMASAAADLEQAANRAAELLDESARA